VIEACNSSQRTRFDASETAEELDGNDAGRGALLVYNEPGAADCYVALGKTPTTTDYTIRVVAGAFLNATDLGGGKIWTGPVTAVWASATGATQVTKVK